MLIDKNALQEEADRCVKCGLCLPACPTYQIAGNEADSPRGRISLIEGLLAGNLEPDADLRRHLDACLLCRRCEARCPSGVHFTRLMDGARTLAATRHAPMDRLRTGILSHPGLGKAAISISRLLPAALHADAGLAGALRRRPPYQGFRNRPSQPTRRLGRLGLFLGCVARTTQNDALHAAQNLLTLAGYEVLIPQQQGCCGAMHAHQGLESEARQMADINAQAFSGLALDAIISLASGCGLHLQENGHLSAPHYDISDFLARSGVLQGLHFSPLHARALLHMPCTLSNGLQGGTKIPSLLANIPGLQVLPLTEGYGCCGGAGTQLLTHPEQGRKLRAPLVDHIMQEQPDYLLTSNPGCALHLAAGCNLKRLEVLHPVQLLERQCAAAEKSA